MKILVLDDRGSVNVHVAGMLEDEGHIVIRAFNCNDAESYWKKCDCLIVDLNLPTDGLSEDQIVHTRGGLLTGWVWLKTHVLSHKPEIAERTIIFSEYIANLREVVSTTEIGDVILISKRSPGSSVEKLLRSVKSICAKVTSI